MPWLVLLLPFLAALWWIKRLFGIPTPNATPTASPGPAPRPPRESDQPTADPPDPETGPPATDVDETMSEPGDSGPATPAETRCEPGESGPATPAESGAETESQHGEVDLAGEDADGSDAVPDNPSPDLRQAPAVPETRPDTPEFGKVPGERYEEPSTAEGWLQPWPETDPDEELGLGWPTSGATPSRALGYVSATDVVERYVPTRSAGFADEDSDDEPNPQHAAEPASPSSPVTPVWPG